MSFGLENIDVALMMHFQYIANGRNSCLVCEMANEAPQYILGLRIQGQTPVLSHDRI